MKLQEYIDLLEQAVANFKATFSQDDFPDEELTDMNDEFMLELYETTDDSRKA